MQNDGNGVYIGASQPESNEPLPMARTDDDPFAPPPKKVAHEIGQNLDALSVDELDERIALLNAETARLAAARAAKDASRAAAAAFFKT